jgi:site-specific recombinase XerD
MFPSPPAGAPAERRSERTPSWFATALAIDGGAGLTILDVDRRFEEFCEYATSSLGHSASSVHGYRATYACFRRFLLATGRPIAEALFAIEEWTAWNRKRQVSPVTVNTYWRLMRVFFRELARLDGIPSPYDGMRGPALPARVPKAHSAKECARILAAAENIPWRSAYERHLAVALFATILYAGLRRGELLKLQFIDVNLDAGTIRISRGKGRAGGKDRMAYFGAELRHILTAFVQERKRRRIEGPGFFASPHSGQPISLSTLRRIHARVRRACGFAFSIHALRHSFVTMLLASGVPLHVAQELAGHTNITTTAGYLRVWDEDKRREIQKVSYRSARFT